LFVFDITDREAPREIQYCPVAGNGLTFVEAMVVHERKLYLADYWSGVHILDLTDPTVPRPEAHLPGAYPTGIAVAGNVLYINRINGLFSYVFPAVSDQ